MPRLKNKVTKTAAVKAIKDTASTMKKIRELQSFLRFGRLHLNTSFHFKHGNEVFGISSRLSFIVLCYPTNIRPHDMQIRGQRYSNFIKRIQINDVVDMARIVPVGIDF